MTMETKHTKGPWNTGALMTRVEVLPNGWRMPMCIADCGAKHGPESESERVANARLIAAAPDLAAAHDVSHAALEAANHLLRTLTRHDISPAEVEVIRHNLRCNPSIIQQIDWAIEQARAALTKAGVK
jgi:hypothetical protein